jgi:hypothetical protein
MRIVAFLKSPMGNLALFFGFIAVGGLLLYQSNARSRAQSAQMTKVEGGGPAMSAASIFRTSAPFKPPASGTDTDAEPTSATAKAKAPSGPKPLPISLFSASKKAQEAQELSKNYAPFGRLIPCETVITLESSKLDTPVIGLVTEDVWNNGRLIIPAGAEVHGRASLDHSRDRIAASGKWVIVWRDATNLNGTELVVSGIALDREKDDTTGQYGLLDGSAGLTGAIIKTDDMEEIKLFAATFLAGMASGFQQLQTQVTPLGISQISTGSARNAALQGTASVLNLYAQQIQAAIEQDGVYVRVPTGKQFYLYVTQTVDQAQGTRDNQSNKELWRKTDEK